MFPTRRTGSHCGSSTIASVAPKTYKIFGLIGGIFERSISPSHVLRRTPVSSREHNENRDLKEGAMPIQFLHVPVHLVRHRKKQRRLNLTISNLFLPMHTFQSNYGCCFLMYFDRSSDGSRTKKMNFDITSKTPDKPCQGTEEELQPASRIQNYPPQMFQCMLWLRL